jgi:sterol desaturase/sphingolipid hydroxylase (fatty acid hydroxylase superfamily)
LAAVRNSVWFKLFLHTVLLLGYAFALISLLLRKEKILAFSALALIMTATLMGGTSSVTADGAAPSIYFGLDFFVLNVVFAGFLFLPLERLWPSRTDQIVFRPEWQEDMFYYLVSSLFVQILAYLTMAPAKAVTGTAAITDLRAYIGSQPFLLQVGLIMLFTDFVQYWVHRLFHQVPFLWRFHAVHHSAQHMDWLAGARMHFLEIVILRSLTAIPMLSFGFNPTAIQTYILIVYIYSAFLHANVGWSFGPLERFLATPRYHHWHHGIEKEAVDVNFAIHFPLLDWLFGTHHMPKNAWPTGYGIPGHPVPSGYWQQFLYPFRRPDAAVLPANVADGTGNHRKAGEPVA